MHDIRLRILFVGLSTLGLIQVYTFLYQKIDMFGLRYKSV